MRHTTRALVALAALAVLGAAVVGGCGGATDAQPASPSPSAPPPGPADITGVVGDLTPGADAQSVSILVVADGSADDDYDKASVTVGPGATVWTVDGRRGDASDLAQGARIAVWFEGPVRESYPVQATAGVVQILTSD
ncbi:MAG TPA: DUF3221 domain-containing protein [Thermoleophilia bacterium]|nr:DUF3221 domain-containing protein [Thermoleophilia bacterium]